MADKKMSRNAPCPCGSGKKFKQCCLGKEPAPGAGPFSGRRLLPAVAPRPARLPLGFFSRIDARLRELATAHPEPADWKPLVANLTERTAPHDRMAAYQALRQAGVLQADVAAFLLGHGIQMLLFDDLRPGDAEEEGDPFARITPILLRRYGASDLADLFTSDKLAYDRTYERGRQFFHGPPDAELAQRLRLRGIID